MSGTLSELGRWLVAQGPAYQAAEGRVHIDTLDNPGWSIKVELDGSDLAGRLLPMVEFNRTETDWCHCFTRDGKFMAFGGPGNLSEIIGRFIAWTQKKPEATASHFRHTPQTEVDGLQEWYASHCDGDWEHGAGVRIQSQPQASWSIVLSLGGTTLEGATLPPPLGIGGVRVTIDSHDYLATCDADNLEASIRAFLDWSAKAKPSVANRHGTGEAIALIAGIGALVGTGVLLFTLLNDWRLDQLKAVADYLRLAGVIVLPFVLTLAICRVMMRTAKR